MTKSTKVAPTPEQVEAKAIAKAEASLAEKYGKKVVAGSVHRAPASSKYGKKLLCTINTRGVNGKYDKNTRLIATSDVFQVHHTVEVAAELRKQRLADKRAEQAPKVKAAPEAAASKLGV